MLKHTFRKKKAEIELSAFAKGTVVLLQQVPDPVFAQNMMGEGIAIQPMDGNIYAPCDACVVFVAPTHHAIGLQLENGIELLLHLGLDTVHLDGKGITPLCQVGDHLMKNQTIAVIDQALIEASEVNMISMLVFTNLCDYHIQVVAQGEIEEQQVLLKLDR